MQISETNIGALTSSKTYTSTVDSKNIFDLYQSNIKNPGSLQVKEGKIDSGLLEKVQEIDRIFPEINYRIYRSLEVTQNRCRRRLKPRLHKQSLPPQTEENNVILTARSSYLFVRFFFHNKPIPAATNVPATVIGSGTGSYS
ncbi:MULTISPECIES: hypothetical protein [unclassified Microcoleus]|uniref:hypothetical protein n=1 Tax=unclassified Microcoleus TaxID=2642155 RepID=UPI0025CDC3B3|nr:MULTISPECIES: hypothetical protein [unclassified Microcoleus]